MAFGGLASTAFAADEKHQYVFEDIKVVAARADEPIREELSVEKAAAYLEAGATAWTKERGCISCHTNGSYLLLRPALVEVLGNPSEEIRSFYVSELEKREAQELAKLSSGIQPTQLAYLAGGLAEWDAHVTGAISLETSRALSLMLKVQAEDGSYSNQDCWPPFESSDFHGTTVAAMAAATAPGYLETLDVEGKERFQKLVNYLQTTEPANDYGRLLLLWTSTRIEGLISAEKKQKIVAAIFDHQQEDGGWSIRSFSAPEDWGSGNREDKLRAEEDFDNPPSDGHQTGLAIVVLCDAGVAPDDARIARGIEWITRNQRESGRWWTRSLNNDKDHFITFSGTCYPLLALAKTDRLPKVGAE